LLLDAYLGEGDGLALGEGLGLQQRQADGQTQTRKTLPCIASAQLYSSNMLRPAALRPRVQQQPQHAGMMTHTASQGMPLHATTPTLMLLQKTASEF
jgi:hypothetical protein